MSPLYNVGDIVQYKDIYRHTDDMKGNMKINRAKKSTDYRVRDRVLILAGDYKDKIGTVQGHDGNLLIVSFDKESEFKGVHFMNVIKWAGM